MEKDCRHLPLLNGYKPPQTTVEVIILIAHQLLFGHVYFSNQEINFPSKTSMLLPYCIYIKQVGVNVRKSVKEIHKLNATLLQV